MSPHLTPELFSPREIARAAGVSEERVLRVLGAAATPHALVPHDEAVRVGRTLLASGPDLPALMTAELFERVSPDVPRSPVASVPLAMSGTLHGLAFAVVFLVTTLGLDPRAASQPASGNRPQTARLVFMVTPGPGGGGGGGGRRQTTPPERAARAGDASLSSPLPERRPPPQIEPTPPAPEPPPPAPAAEELPPVLAPVVASASDAQSRPGTVDGEAATASRGSGSRGGAGTGQGTGLGEGDGPGIGSGSGGGTGGGPYGPGSGVEPPRLLSEVKPDYTDEARRRGIEGEVIMEIVVQRDGGVGDVRVLRGLGAGLNERAVQAVRRWRFAPAHLRGTPVDVVVEVSVEFRMR